MRQLAPLSVLRERNDKLSLSIDFKRAALSECIVEESESITYEKMFSNLLQDEEMLAESWVRRNIFKIMNCQKKQMDMIFVDFWGKFLNSERAIWVKNVSEKY